VTPPKNKGLFIGNSHKNGGIPSKVKETGQLIEIEGDEYYICREAFNSSDTFTFVDNTNKEILEKIYSKYSCKLNQSLMEAGDFIVCKLVVLDRKKHSRSGTVKDILNEMQAEKSCKVENGSSSFKLGGRFREITKKDGSKEKVKVYSEEELLKRSQKKKDSLKNISKNIKKLRRKVNSDLKSSSEKTFLTALAVYTMLETSERVGNSESASNGHFGITGLKKSHVNINGNNVNFNYKGKSGVDHDKKISNNKLAEYFKKAKSISKSENIFETSEGFKVKNDGVNRYLKTLDVSAKDIRGYSANKWIVSKLNRLNPEDTEHKRKRQFNEVAKEIAQKVGHGAATLKKHYLLPELQMQWIDKGKVIDLAKFKDMNLAYGGAVKTEAQKEKVGKVMKEFKDEKLKTSYGKKVTDRKQAVAIALSEASREKKEQGGTINSNWFEDELSFLNW
jgi:hypothetical protein